MKHTAKLFTLLAAVLIFAACNKDKEELRQERDIVYTVAPAGTGHDMSTDNADATTSVHLYTEAEWQALLDRFCDYAEEGSTVTFHNANKSPKGTKDATTFSTTDREEMKRWMAQMEDAGMTVTVSYDPNTGTWNGTAYATAPLENTKRLSRVTMTKSCGSGQFISKLWRPEYDNYFGLHTVYNYNWNGDQLTSVDMDEETIIYMSDGVTVDSVLHVHNTATFDYVSGNRTSLYLYDNDSNLVKEYRYVYNDSGRLVQEFQTDHAYDAHHMDYYYYKEFMGLDWYFAPSFLNFAFRATLGFDIHYDSAGYLLGITPEDRHITDGPSHISYDCLWSNGDLLRTVSSFGVLQHAYQYSFSLQPYGISTGTTSLLPGYNTFFPWMTFWSRHNLTHISGQGPEMWISHTYNSDGTIATAQMTWTDESTIRWVFEYLD
ncbi:MAG: hypothetical protein J6X79_04565 [Bacteroidales bacterium]|nr:hypothetical protein [Bacteroidales bacterium]